MYRCSAGLFSFQEKDFRLMATIISASAFRGRGSRLYLNGKIVARIIADETYQKMWRVVGPDGSLSDMANVARARDAALTQALRDLNAKETPLEGPRTRPRSSAYGQGVACP